MFCDSEWQVQSAGHPRFWIKDNTSFRLQNLKNVISCAFNKETRCAMVIITVSATKDIGRHLRCRKSGELSSFISS